MNIKYYTHEGKTYMEVIAQKRDENGKKRRKSSRFTKSGQRISSLDVAEAVKAQLRVDLDKEVVVTRSSYTWSQWQEKALEDMRKQGLQESTVRNYANILNKWMDPQWNSRPLRSFTRDDVYDFIHSYLESRLVTDWSRYNIYKAVRRFFEMAMEHGVIDRNPARGIKVHTPSEQGEVLTPGEVETLLIKGKQISHDYYPHWSLALMTGMRNGELYALRWSNIDLEAGLIHVVEQFTNKDGLHLPKRGKKRPIDLSSELRMFLMNLKRTYGAQKERLWSWEYENQLTNRVIAGHVVGEKVYKKVKIKKYFVRDDLVLPRMNSWRQGSQAKELRAFCRQIGLREVKFHDLRATYITNLLSNGVAISKVMKQVGHSKMSTTDGYHRLTGVDVKGVSEKLSYKMPLTDDHLGDEGYENVVSLFPKSDSK